MPDRLNLVATLLVVTDLIHTLIHVVKEKRSNVPHSMYTSGNLYELYIFIITQQHFPTQLFSQPLHSPVILIHNTLLTH